MPRLFLSGRRCFVSLLLLQGLLVAASFFAPYPYAQQDRLRPLSSPDRLSWRSESGSRSLRPWVLQGDGEQRRVPLAFWSRSSGNRGEGGSFRLFAVSEGAHVHLLGTDRLGRDVLSRLLAGARISLIAGLLATALAVLLAGVLGALAGLAGGWLDHLLMRLAELFLALPWLYLLLALRAFLPLDLSPSLSGILVVVLLGGLGWAAPARQVRGLVLGLRQREFLLAARGLGVSRWRILRRHLLPQILPLLSTQGSQLIPRMITAEVSLSFLGLGVAEPLPSLGSLLAELLHLHVLVSAWWMFSPAALLIGIILSYHLCARALQQRFLSSAS